MLRPRQNSLHLPSYSLLWLIVRLDKEQIKEKVFGGGGWIRTSVGVSQQIYSLPPLATRTLHPKGMLDYEDIYPVSQA